LLDHLNSGTPAFTLEDIPKIIAETRIPVFMPFHYLFENDPLEHSWDITSDSIAAYLAEVLHAQKLILLKDVDGIFTCDPKQFPPVQVKLLPEINLNHSDLTHFHSCIDTSLPKFLRQYHRSCFITNGLHPERLVQILQNKKTIYTKIVI
ncbi:MAG: amino acid kinase family protein, partial [Candidatus Helarchaeota archaeon]